MFSGNRSTLSIFVMATHISTLSIPFFKWRTSVPCSVKKAGNRIHLLDRLVGEMARHGRNQILLAAFRRNLNLVNTNIFSQYGHFQRVEVNLQKRQVNLYMNLRSIKGTIVTVWNSLPTLPSATLRLLSRSRSIPCFNEDGVLDPAPFKAAVLGLAFIWIGEKSKGWKKYSGWTGIRTFFSLFFPDAVPDKDNG